MDKLEERKKKKSAANKAYYARKKELKADKKVIFTPQDMTDCYKQAKENPFQSEIISGYQATPLCNLLRSKDTAGYISTEPQDKGSTKTEKPLKPLPDSEEAETVFDRKLSVYLTALIILIFLVANAYFIVSEQASFYQFTGYTRQYSIFIALLTESATVLLSYFAISKQKPILFAILIPTVLLTFAILYMGIQRKESAELRSKRIGEILQDEVDSLEAKILSLKVDNKSAGANERLLSLKQNELKEWLKIPSDIGQFETYAHAALRLLAVIWNVIFPGLLAALWISPKRFFPD